MGTDVNLIKKGSTSNTFNKGEVKFGHARKVWREQREVLPAGGTISNVADFVSAGLIPSGRPVVFDSAANTIKVIKDSEITAAADVNTLGINGFLKEDAPVVDNKTVATGTVVVDGDLYGYMFDDAILTKLKKMNQPNGLKIRFV